jgi:quercetin dioxygenase-like cupin family protein
MTQHYRGGAAIIEDLFPGARLEFLHSESMTVAMWDFDAGCVVATHAHPAEQVTHCSEGVLEVNLDGQVITLQPGDSVVIPSGVPHSARAQAAASGFDAFHPVREDYRF